MSGADGGAGTGYEIVFDYDAMICEAVARLACTGIGRATVQDAEGRTVKVACESTGLIAFETVPSGEYVITGLQLDKPVAAPRNLTVAQPGVLLNTHILTHFGYGRRAPYGL